MDIIVVTGGIGSGKSEVCRILQEEYCCGVYNADQSVKRLYDSDPKLVEDIEALVHESLRDDEGRFVPARLAARIFADREILLGVEALVFPALTDDFRKWAEGYSDDRFVIFESATILEKPQLSGFGDKVILVDAPLSLRLDRACERDEASREKISERMKNQKLMNAISEGLKCDAVDKIIRNVGTLADLKTDTLRVMKEIYENI